jgi:Taurine catabolism dioxygenase TauD, TfdA family
MQAAASNIAVQAYWMPGCSSCLRMKEACNHVGRAQGDLLETSHRREERPMYDYSQADFWPTEAKRGWSAAEFNSAVNTHVFTAEEIAILGRLVDKTKELGLAVTEITREQFDAPELHETLARMVRQLKDGQGIVTLKGFPVNERSHEDIWRMYWGIGAHFGIGVSQDVKGNLTGQVMVQEGANTRRVYGSNAEAVLHADRIDILSLLCIKRAKSGGENGFASSLKVWEIIERERPDVLALLKRGYPCDRGGEQPEGDSDVTPYRVPVFGEVGRLRSAYLGGNAILGAVSKYFPELLAVEDVDALEFLASVLARPELKLNQQLQPGEAVFLNNMEVLHARASFVDGDNPEEKRRLFRLWLQGRPRRPIPADMNVIRNRSGNLGIERRVPELQAAE